MRRAVRIAPVLLALVAATAALFTRHGRAFSLWAARRHNGCALRACLEAPSQDRAHRQTRQRIQQSMRLLRRDPAGLELWETPLGPLWSPLRRQSAFWLADTLAEAQAGLYSHGDVRVRPGDTVLDCGANIGVFARQALSAGAARVVAIEPGPASVACLHRNFSSEIAAHRLIICPVGVWHREETLRLFTDENTSVGDSLVLPRGSTGIDVPLTRIDTLVGHLALSRVDFVKMDIEGAEQEALAGARETLARFRPRLAISAYHKGDDPRRIPALVFSACPDYRLTLGPCILEKSRLAPKVMFFE
jgi:FkbM family methyltransferase